MLFILWVTSQPSDNDKRCVSLMSLYIMNLKLFCIAAKLYVNVVYEVWLMLSQNFLDFVVNWSSILKFHWQNLACSNWRTRCMWINGCVPKVFDLTSYSCWGSFKSGCHFVETNYTLHFTLCSPNSGLWYILWQFQHMKLLVIPDWMSWHSLCNVMYVTHTHTHLSL